MSAGAVAGLHHITAITGDPQTNADFYIGTLGLRLVKRTVNFDDPGTYHLYYGDAAGTPGSILTFFPYLRARQGHGGRGMAESFSYALPADDLALLETRLAAAGLATTDVERFGARVVLVRDPHRQPLEFVAHENAARFGHFFGVTLEVEDPDATAGILTDIFGYVPSGEEASAGQRRFRFRTGHGPDTGASGAVVDLLQRDGVPRARPGAGTIHHVAFRAANRDHQSALREALLAAGHSVTPRIDRQYFDAVYFREPNGILFEIATDPPGFAIDEAPDALGASLMLPPQYEPHRREIEAHLPPLQVPA